MDAKNTRKNTGKVSSDSGLDDIPVVRADGTETTLGTIDAAPAAPATTSNGKSNGKEIKPVPKSGGKGASPKAKQTSKEAEAAVGRAKAKAESTKNAQKASEKLSRARASAGKTLDRVERALVRLSDPLHADYRAEVNKVSAALLGYLKEDAWAPIVGEDDRLKTLLSGVNDEVKRVKALKDAEKAEAKKQAEAAKAAKAEAAKAAKAEKEARVLKDQGLTGDAEKDAELTKLYTETENVSHSLALAPAPVRELTFLVREGVVLTTTGLILDADLPPTVWSEVLGRLVGLADVNQFAIGDALNFGAEHYHSGLYEHVRRTYNLGLSTVKNYKYVSGTWPVDERVEGVGFAFHKEAAALYRQNPALARNLLAQVYQERRPLSWLTEQVKAATGAAEAPSAVAKRAAHLDALAIATDEQRAADFAKFGNNVAAINREHAKEVVALVEFAQKNDLVENTFVIRNVVWLTARVTELEETVKSLRLRLADYEGERAYRDSANARIIEAEADDAGASAAVAGFAADESEDESDAVDPYAGLDSLDPTEEDLASEDDAFNALLDRDDDADEDDSEV